MTTLVIRRVRVRVPFPLVVLLAVVGWVIAWFAAAPFAAWFAYDPLGLEQGDHFGEAVAVFVYDVPKVLLLLLGTITVVTLAHPDRGSERIAGCCGMVLPAEITEQTGEGS